MKRDYFFVEEKTHANRLKFLFFLIIGIIIILALGIVFWNFIYLTLTNNSAYKSVYSSIIELTSVGLFYTGFFGGLFFLPIPQELFFYMGLFKGNNIFFSILLIMAGYLLAQFVNYYLGSKLGKLILPIVSKKTVYKSRRVINKYGSFGIFIFNLFPLPAPMITFALGLVRYNIYRLFFYTFLGSLIKYIALFLLFYLTR